MHDPGIDAFIAALPKVELHVHLLGSASPETVAALARRHPDRGMPTSDAELRRYYEFTGFRHFTKVYTAVNELVTTGADVQDLVTGLAADLSLDNVRYAEVTVTPLSHLAAGIDPGELAAALATGRQRAARLDGVELAWVFDISGDNGSAAGETTVDWIRTYQPPGTTGFGLGGPERGVRRAQFRAAFARARSIGLHSLPHAGETTGPAEVWAAVRDLGAERIGHGIGSAADPRLLDHLAEREIPLEVCPTSNLCTRTVSALWAHPLPALLAAGIPVVLGTDDPGMFATTPNAEYRLCHDEFKLGRAALAELAREGVRASFCDPGLQTVLHREIDEVERTMT